LDNVRAALLNLKSKNTSNQILSLNTQQGTLQLKLNDIIYIEGNGNYSNIYLVKNRKELVSKTVSNLEELLEKKDFFRCHKSYLINKDHIVSKPNSFTVQMSNNIGVPVSRRRKSDFSEWINKQ